MRTPTEEFLSPLEVSRLEAFIQDEALVEAVRKVLLAGVYYNGVLYQSEKANPFRNFALDETLLNPQYSDAQVGADLRAKAQGIRAVELAFKEFEKFKNEAKKDEKKDNPAL